MSCLMSSRSSGCCEGRGIDRRLSGPTAQRPSNPALPPSPHLGPLSVPVHVLLQVRREVLEDQVQHGLGVLLDVLDAQELDNVVGLGQHLQQRDLAQRRRRDALLLHLRGARGAGRLPAGPGRAMAGRPTAGSARRPALGSPSALSKRNRCFEPAQRMSPLSRPGTRARAGATAPGCYSNPAPGPVLRAAAGSAKDGRSRRSSRRGPASPRARARAGSGALPSAAHLEPGLLQRHQAAGALAPRLVDLSIRPLADLLQLLVLIHRGAAARRAR